MMKLTRFTKSDWFGFCGATSFMDESEPLIGSISVTGWKEEDGVLVIVDHNGIEISFTHPDTQDIDPDCDELFYDNIGVNEGSGEVLNFLLQTKDEMTVEELRELFKKFKLDDLTI